MSKKTNAKVKLGTSMMIFGTVGIFVTYIPLPSSILAMARGIIGTLFLLLVTLLTRKKISLTAIRKNLLILCISGFAIGINWILLFEAYRYTTVATATLCYYLAPVFVILVSPIFLKEHFTLKKFVCVLVALMGMVFVSGVLKTGITDRTELKGIFCGLGAAAFYASVVILNKKLSDIDAYDKTIMQLTAAVVVILPYALLTEDMGAIRLSATTAILVVIVGMVHTGAAYAMYFGSMKDLKAQTIAIFSYIDPVVAILLSAFVLGQGLDGYGMIGAVMILGATFISEYSGKTERKN